MAEPAPDVSPPAGYPIGFDTVVHLSGERQVAVRPVLPSDAPALVAAVRAADPRDVRGRFGLKTDLLDDAALAHLAEVDYRSEFRLLALADDGGIAAAASYRVVPAEGQPTTAEVSVVVTPPFRREGLATLLVRLLAARAEQCGVEQFTGMAASDNTPALELARNAQAFLARAGGVTLASLPVSVVLRMTDRHPVD